jgi:hypothetical protein
MHTSSRRVVRDIIIILALVGLMALAYYYMRNPRTNLGEDIHINKDAMPPQGAQGMDSGGSMPGHGPGIFPEEGDEVVAVALGHSITTCELNQEANRIFRKMGINPDSPMAQGSDFLSLMRFQALGEILKMLVIIKRAPELGIDAEKLIDDALKEWAEGYGSPEEKLAAVGDTRGVTIDRMRGMFFRDLVLPAVEAEVTKDAGDKSDDEKMQIFAGWMIEGLKDIDIEFHDDDLAQSWEKYISGFKNAGANKPAPPETGTNS